MGEGTSGGLLGVGEGNKGGCPRCVRGPRELSGLIYNNLYKYIYINACPFSVTLSG